MRIQNTSAFHRNAKLLPLIKFVDAAVKDVADVKFVFEDLASPTAYTGGITLQQGIITIVVIGLSRPGHRYPFVSRHSDAAVVRAVGKVKLYSWEEEVLFVMLHEARHVRQFSREQFTVKQKVEAEIDAEAFAMRYIKKYRKLPAKVQVGTIFDEAFAI